MINYEEIYQRLRKEYTDEEIAEAMLIPKDWASEKEKKEAHEEFGRLRMKMLAERTPEEKLYGGLITIQFQIKAAIEGRLAPAKTSGDFLRQYIKVIGKTQKEFAADISLHPSRVSRIIKGKEKISKAIAYRLEQHSGNTIDALLWWKLGQKETEEEIKKETKERDIERQYVKNIVYKAS